MTVREPYVGPCPTTVRRSTLTDAEWEADVAESLARLAGLSTAEYDPEDDLPDPPAVTPYDAPCAVCGTTGPCMYDPNGLPLIHAVEET